MSWHPVADKKDIWETNEVKTVKTSKVQKPVIVVPATDKHQAQGQLVSEDVNVGTNVKQFLSGCLSSKEKADMLNRADQLISDIQAARSRANDIEANKISVGSKLLKFITGR